MSYNDILVRVKVERGQAHFINDLIGPKSKNLMCNIIEY